MMRWSRGVAALVFSAFLLVNPALFTGCGGGWNNSCGDGYDPAPAQAEMEAMLARKRSWSFTTDEGAGVLELNLRRDEPVAVGLWWVKSAAACSILVQLRVVGTMTLRFTPTGGAEEVLVDGESISADMMPSALPVTFSKGTILLQSADGQTLELYRIDGEQLGASMRTIQYNSTTSS